MQLLLFHYAIEDYYNFNQRYEDMDLMEGQQVYWDLLADLLLNVITTLFLFNISETTAMTKDHDYC